MAIVLAGNGVQSNSAASAWSSPWDWDGPGQHPLAQFFKGAGYNQIYAGHPDVYTVVKKGATAETILPLKVYRRAEKGRLPARSTALGRLLGQPSVSMSQLDWRLWAFSTYLLNGEAAWFKRRDEFNRLVELQPIHPTRLRYGPPMGGQLVRFSDRATPEELATENRYWYLGDNNEEAQIWRRDLFLWKTFNPDSMYRGLSPLEPLRATLEEDAAAQKAIEALWKNGGKPSFILQHPASFGSNPAVTQRLASQFAAKHSGVEQWGKPLVLEEGMTAHPLVLDDNLRYLDLRKLTLAKVAQVYLTNTVAVGDNEKSSYNNVTQLLRDFYRSTMPPLLNSFESAFQFDVVDGRHGGSGSPEFPPSMYVEHEMDGVLRGDFETRIEAMSKAIQNGVLQPAEAREMENRPFVDGSDRLFINGAIVPLDEASRNLPGLPSAAQKDGQTTDLTASSAVLSPSSFAALMGRLGRVESLDQIDVVRLVDGLTEAEASAVSAELTEAEMANADVAGFRAQLKGLK